MAWFMAEQAVADLSKMHPEEFAEKYKEHQQPDGSFRFGLEPAKREEADHDKRSGLFSW